MKVLEYLKTHSITKLANEFNIKIKSYPEHNLVVLNYDQIESNKSEPIVMECRGLILGNYGIEGWYVVSRSFDRFFNYGEQPDTQSHIDFSKAVLYEKIDGSLIRIYKYKDIWYVATRGTAFAESEVNGFGITFKQLVFKALDVETEKQFQDLCNSTLHSGITYIFEIASVENRVVKRYSGYTLYFLAARVNNYTYCYVTEQEKNRAVKLGASLPKQYYFSTIEECLETAKHLKDLDEGYVLYQDNLPVCKIKSPVYVLAHHLRGEGLNPKRISQLVLSGESEEYLTYFENDKDIINPYQEGLKKLYSELTYTFKNINGIESQKDFALAVKDFKYSSVMFSCRKLNKNPIEVFENMSENYKIELLIYFTS